MRLGLGERGATEDLAGDLVSSILTDCLAGEVFLGEGERLGGEGDCMGLFLGEG